MMLLFPFFSHVCLYVCVRVLSVNRRNVLEDYLKKKKTGLHLDKASMQGCRLEDLLAQVRIPRYIGEGGGNVLLSRP